MSHILLVTLGGGLGSLMRYLVGAASLRYFGPGFPWGTFLVNVAGSFLMGLFIALLIKKGGSEEWRLFVATGILGGFTTFSAFSLDAISLWERGHMLTTFGYIGGSLALCLLAVMAGLMFGRAG